MFPIAESQTRAAGNEGTWVGKSNNNILTSNDNHLCCLQFCKNFHIDQSYLKQKSKA